MVVQLCVEIYAVFPRGLQIFLGKTVKKNLPGSKIILKGMFTICMHLMSLHSCPIGYIKSVCWNPSLSGLVSVQTYQSLLCKGIGWHYGLDWKKSWTSLKSYSLTQKQLLAACSGEEQLAFLIDNNRYSCGTVLSHSVCPAPKRNFQTYFSFLLCLIDVHIVQAVCSPGSYPMLTTCTTSHVNNHPLLTTPFFKEDKVKVLLLCGLVKQKGCCITVGKTKILLFGIERTFEKGKLFSVRSGLRYCWSCFGGRGDELNGITI